MKRKPVYIEGSIETEGVRMYMMESWFTKLLFRLSLVSPKWFEKHILVNLLATQIKFQWELQKELDKYP